MGVLLFALEWWAVPAVVVLGGFWALAEFGWWLEHRPGHLLKLGKRAVNEQVAAAIREMEAVAAKARPSRTTWW